MLRRCRPSTRVGLSGGRVPYQATRPPDENNRRIAGMTPAVLGGCRFSFPAASAKRGNSPSNPSFVSSAAYARGGDDPSSMQKTAAARLEHEARHFVGVGVVVYTFMVFVRADPHRAIHSNRRPAAEAGSCGRTAPPQPAPRRRRSARRRSRRSIARTSTAHR